ncbi:MAG: hypothetical protein H0U77_05250 [Nocardioidaceae bacterium]|nr:hypothetical protein [Nocardioidaceae bacterium]
MQAFVENDVGMAFDHGSAAWVFDLDHWGVCGQGPDEAAALADLAVRVGSAVIVAERIRGDERAFLRDRRPATDQEWATTLTVLAAVRPQTIAFVQSHPELLDRDDPNRALPEFAGWRTLRQMAWHIADTESRYYLPMAGLPGKQGVSDLLEELGSSHDHVTAVITSMAPDIDVATEGTEWTSTKLLRRLAWHERGELEAMTAMAERLEAAC